MPSFEILESRRLMSAVELTQTIWQGPVRAMAIDATRPSVTATDPAAGSVNVRRDAFVAAYVNLPNVGHGVDEDTLTSANVKLYKTSDTTHAAIAGQLNTTGGGDAIIFTPSTLLSSNTQYTFQVTSGLTDTSGAAFNSFSMSFTTGTAGSPVPSTIGFNKVALSNATGRRFTGVTVGPDNKLYAGTMTGEILRWNINSDGTLSSTTTINTIKNGNGGKNRIVTGLHFDPSSTSSNLILWVTHGDGLEEGAANWTGKLSRLSGSTLGTYQDYVTNLPRSIRDHLTNQIDFDSSGRLYISQGSMNAMGAPDNAWGQRSEQLLSAAILRVDTAAIASRISSGQGALNVKTSDGGTYNPSATGAAVTLYATGVRNAYDILWHSNGNLYAPTNGSAPGGNTPAGGGAPALTNVQQVEPDWLFKIRKDKYYGHPNPKRGEYVLNGGNPTSGTDKYQVNAYPVGVQPDPDWDPAIYSFGSNRSPNGIIEYKSNAFGGALQGSMLVVRYSGGDDIIVLTPDASGNIPSSNVSTGLTGLTGFVDPLDLTEHVATGNIYVVEHGAEKITLLRPKTPAVGGGGTDAPVRDPNTLYFNDPVGGVASPARTMTIKNNGTSSFNITAIGLSGTDASMFRIVTKPTLPKSLAPGATTTVTVEFNPPSGTSLGVRKASLVVTTSSTSTPTLTYNLRALATAGLTGANEPSLQRILDLYQVPINVGDADPSTSDMPLPLASGNNAINLQKFVRADTSKSVTVEPLAVFASSGTPTIRFGYYNTSTGSTSEVVTFTDSQSVNPGVTSGALSFNPSSSTFGFYTNAPAFGSRLSYSEDAKNTWEPVTSARKKMQVYPLKDKNGATVANAYVIAWEEVTGSYDYQDFLAVIRNVRDPNSPVDPPPPPPPGDDAIAALKLVNADTDQAISDFTNGTAINYATMPQNLTVRADTSGTIGSIRWAIDGANVRTENFAPWALGGDVNASDLLPYAFALGGHTLTVTAYSSANASGTVLQTMHVSFTVSNSTTPTSAIAALKLVNADTDQAISDFTTGTAINYSTMPSHLTVRADTNGTVGSIRWAIDGTSIRTESFAPWCLGGDVNGSDLQPYAFPSGSHTLTVTAFSGSGGTGSVLETKTVSFTVSNTPPVLPGATIQSLTLMNADNDQPIGQFENNTTINYALLPPNLTVRAETSGSIGSVRWIINGTTIRTENYAPWALGGDINGSDLQPYAFQYGTHTFSAIAFSGKDGSGSVLKKIDLEFHVGFAP